MRTASILSICSLILISQGSVEAHLSAVPLETQYHPPIEIAQPLLCALQAPRQKNQKDYDNQWKQNRQKLKALLALEVNDSLQVGLSRFKVGPLKSQMSQIVEICPQLQPKTSQPSTSRGIGLEVRLKLD